MGWAHHSVTIVCFPLLFSALPDLPCVHRSAPLVTLWLCFCVEPMLLAIGQGQGHSVYANGACLPSQELTSNTSPHLMSHDHKYIS